MYQTYSNGRPMFTCSYDGVTGAQETERKIQERAVLPYNADGVKAKGMAVKGH